MDYYETRRKAFNDIDSMINDKIPYDNIVFKIATRYGFSGKIVKQRMDMLKNVSEKTNNE